MQHLELNLHILDGLLVFMPAMELNGFLTAFTTRVELARGGPRFCNYGFHGRPGAVACRAKLCRALSLPPEHFTAGEQLHTANAALVSDGLAGSGSARAATRIPATDALATRLPDTPLAVMTADCLPVLLLDPVARACAAAHAGWRGAAQGVLQNTVSLMRREFASKPRNITALAGPHIGPCCYEVGKDVASQVSEPAALSPAGDKFMLDLSLWCETLLREAGVPKKNIHASNLCTACRADLFYSYRADRERPGSNASLIALTKHP